MGHYGVTTKLWYCSFELAIIRHLFLILAFGYGKKTSKLAKLAIFTTKYPPFTSMKTSLGIAALAATSLFFASNSHAAVISWGAATPISTAVGNSSDVSTNGSLVEAFNGVGNDQIGTATPITVNTVVFTPTTSLLGSDPKNGGTNDFSSTTNSGDATYDAVLSTLEYGGGTGLVTINVGGASLVSGSLYEIQVWFSDTRPAQDARIMTFGDGDGGGAGNVVGLNDQFSIGTFTADGTSQALTLASGTPEGIGANFGQSHINAYQIRAIPEPGVAMLGLLGFLGLTLRRRRS